MKKCILIITTLFVLLFSGCSNIQPTPTYNKDYSNQKILIRDIFVKDKYQAEDIIKQLNNSNNKLQTFIDLQQSKSIIINNEPNKRIRYYWTDSSQVIPEFGNKIFELKEGSYLKTPLNTSWGWNIVFLEKKISKQEFHQLKTQAEKVILNRIESYETDYLKDYEQILTTLPKEKSTYIQPANKKEPCKVWFGYTDDDKWFKKDNFKIFWDGRCKNGYADGLGREIEKDDMLDRWGIAIYKNGIPTYYVVNNVLSNNLFEGIQDQNEDISYGVRTIITEKNNDIDIMTIVSQENDKSKITLYSRSSPFWDGSYQYVKSYPNFEYVYNNTQNNTEIPLDFEFFLSDKKSKNGWAIGKPKNQNLITAEYQNNQFIKIDLPTQYNQKADEIIKEVHSVQQKAFQAQEYAQMVKKQYKKKICKDNVKVTFMDNSDYKEICSGKREEEILAKLNKKLTKISEEKIAKLEQQRFQEQQKKEEQHRQELLSIERQRLAAQQRQAAAAQQAANAADTANFNASMDRLNQTLRANTPKFYSITPTFGGGYNVMGF